VKKDFVDWNEQPLARWLSTITRESTKHTYRTGYRLYARFTGVTATQLINEAIEDVRKDPRERTDIVKRRLIAFYNWLVKEAPKRKGPSGVVVGKGLSTKIAHTYVNAVRSLYGTFDVYVKLKGRSALPKPRVTNKRLQLTNLDVKRLLDHTRTPRDRAIILVGFQAGMDESTLCSLTFGDVADGLAKNEHPQKLDLYRPKTGTEYYSFLGQDATEALSAYLNDVKAKGLKPKHSTPLFLKEGSKALEFKRLTTNLVQNMMREVAVRSGLVDEDFGGKDFNPLGFHALRESFGSIMINHGVPDSLVDFWLGHEVGEMSEAYKGPRFQEAKDLYMKMEPFISVATTGDLEEKLRGEIEERNRQLQILVNGLTAENLERKAQVKELSDKVKEFETILQDPLLKDVEQLSRLPGLREAFEDIVVQAKNVLAQKLKREKIE